MSATVRPTAPSATAHSTAARSSREPTRSSEAGRADRRGAERGLSPFRELLERPIAAPMGPKAAGLGAAKPAMPAATRTSSDPSADVAGRAGRPERRDASDEPAALREREASRTATDESPLRPEPLPLEPFRVDPALLPPPSASTPATPARVITEHELAMTAASELVESMRVGRFGRDGHAISLRLRTASGIAAVELREEGGVMRLALQGEGASSDLGERMRRELEARGIELDDLTVG